MPLTKSKMIDIRKVNNIEKVGKVKGEGKIEMKEEEKVEGRVEGEVERF